MMRLFCSFATAICCAVTIGSVAATAESTRPNVLLICVDDLKPALGCYEDPVAVTPNIDRLAASGVTFMSAYCNQAVCSPSRNALLTSLRPQTLGIYDLPTHFRKAAPDALTMPQYFKQNGYRTEGLGKIFHVGHGNIDDEKSWSVPSFRPKAQTYAVRSQDTRTNNRGQVKGAVTESGDVADTYYADGTVAEEAIKRLQTAANQQEPFLLAVGFIRPHLPFVAPKKYWDLYDPAKLSLPTVLDSPAGAPEYAPTNGGELRSYTGVPEKGPVDETLTRHLIHGYYAATSYTDAQIGRVLDALQKTPAWDQTIVVLWGDHGWHLGDHGMWCKHSNYEQAARIPVIVSAPTMPRGVKSNALIESVDIFPTLSELAGLPMPAGLDGRSFAPTLADPLQPARDHVIHVYPRGNRLGRAIRNQRYRMVEWKTWSGSDTNTEFELYDYQSDPLETKNVATSLPDVMRAMQATLASHPAAKPQWQTKATAGKPATTGSTKAKSSDRAAMFKKRDSNGDGKLTKDEFMQHQPDPEQAITRFPRFDKDNDGLLSAEEFIGK